MAASVRVRVQVTLCRRKDHRDRVVCPLIFKVVLGHFWGPYE